MAAEIVDTYAEAFRSLYAQILVTARDRTWLRRAVAAATGHASSTIFCDCEAGLDREIGLVGDASTPDGRPGAVLQFHVPHFRQDRVERLERVLLQRISQNILTCPTARCFNWLESDSYYRLGRKIAYFGDGFEQRENRFDRSLWVIPTMGGEFELDRHFCYADGIMGGNLWFLGATEDAAIAAAERAAEDALRVAGVILPFPGGVAASASKAGSRYSFLFASTYEQFCPTLKQRLGRESKVPDGVTSIMEIIINGRDLQTVAAATGQAIYVARETPGLLQISAGNYNGRLGKSFIHLREFTGEPPEVP